MRFYVLEGLFHYGRDRQVQAGQSSQNQPQKERPHLPPSLCSHRTEHSRGGRRGQSRKPEHNRGEGTKGSRTDGGQGSAGGREPGSWPRALAREGQEPRHPSHKMLRGRKERRRDTTGLLERKEESDAISISKPSLEQKFLLRAKPLMAELSSLQVPPSGQRSFLY